jgi:hypothetical protein
MFKGLALTLAGVLLTACTLKPERQMPELPLNLDWESDAETLRETFDRAGFNLVSAADGLFYYEGFSEPLNELGLPPDLLIMVGIPDIAPDTSGEELAEDDNDDELFPEEILNYSRADFRIFLVNKDDEKERTAIQQSIKQKLTAELGYPTFFKGDIYSKNERHSYIWRFGAGSQFSAVFNGSADMLVAYSYKTVRADD